MEENIENETTKECRAESEDNVVGQISSRMMGLLGEIEDFMSSFHGNTSSNELPVHRRDVPQRLENAVRLLTMARDEVSAEFCSYDLFGEGAEEGICFIEHSAGTIDENRTKSSGHSEIVKSHIDDCIQLGNVKNEMSRVLNSLSHHAKLIRIQDAHKSCSDAEEDDAGTRAAVDSGICSSAAEDAERLHLLEGQRIAEMSTIAEMEQSIKETAINVGKMVEDAKQISDEIDQISALIQKQEITAHAPKTGEEEKESAEVCEKSDFEGTEKSDCPSAAEVEEKEVNVATVQAPEVEPVDSSCGESATDDDTEPETTTDDERDDNKTPMVCNSKLLGMVDPSKILNAHLLVAGVGIEYWQVDSEEDRQQTSRYNFKCKVLDMVARGEGRNSAIAKLNVAVNMLSMIVRRQTNGTLPAEIRPFSPTQLKVLELILGAEVENNSIVVLRKECSWLGAKMPSFKTLSSGGQSGENVVTVQCTALNHTAIGCGRNKRRARRNAADQIVCEYFKGTVDQK